MMKKAGFAGVVAAGLFSVFLLAWRGYEGASGDWVFGFLAVFWSLIMMLRLLTLTEAIVLPEASGYLAHKILRALHEKQEKTREIILNTAFGGSFLLFIFAGLAFATWQVYCAAFPHASPHIDGIAGMVSAFFVQLSGGGDPFGSALLQGRFFGWGQGFLLFLAFCMMGFVFRSFAAERSMTRSALIILSSYAVGGVIACAGLKAGGGLTVESAALTGNGTGSISYLLSTLPAGKALSLFDIMLLESGVIGLALLTFLLFVPLGTIALCAGLRQGGRLVPITGLLAGVALILCFFLAFSPPVAGTMAIAALAVMLSWGASEPGLAALES